MRAFLTGATGFVGSAVARRLQEAGWSLRLLIRPGADRRNLAGLEAEVVEGSLADLETLQLAMRECAAVFHVAADYRLWVPEPAPLYAANVDGTRNVLEAAAAAGVPRVVYTSSVATLGLPADGRPGDEDTPVALADMVGHYKRSKFLAEEIARQRAAEGQDVVIVNPSTPVGPRDIKPTPTGRMVLDAAAGRMPAFVDTGLNLVHVDDVAAGHLLALERGRSGRRYVLGGEDLTLASILAQIAELCGRRPPRIRLPHSAVLPVAYVAEAWARVAGGTPSVTVEGVKLSRKRMFFSSARARAELGFESRPVVEALADAITWFREQGHLPTR
jgi:hopanoid-associated sugar epimerase